MSKHKWAMLNKLPPVGAEVFYMGNTEGGRPPKGTRVTVQAHMRYQEGWADVAIFSWYHNDHDLGVAAAAAPYFKPIDEERSKLHKILNEVVDLHPGDCDRIIDALYANGYQKGE